MKGGAGGVEAESGGGIAWQGNAADDYRLSTTFAVKQTNTWPIFFCASRLRRATHNAGKPA